MATEDELRELAKQKSREKARQRLNSLNSGDLARGLGTNDKFNASNVAPKPRPVANTFSERQQNEQLIEQKESQPSNKQKERLGKIVVDKNTIEQMATTQSAGKVRMKRLAIISLSVIIVVIWAFIIFTKIIKPEEISNNCFLSLDGNAKSNCTLLLNNEEVTEWRTPDKIATRREYQEIEIVLKISGSASYSALVKVVVTIDGQAVNNWGVADSSTDAVVDDSVKDAYQFRLTNLEAGEYTLLSKLTFNDASLCPQLRNADDDNFEIHFSVTVNRM